MILVIGAGGIVGQYLRLTRPPLPIVFTAREKITPHDSAMKLNTIDDVMVLLDHWVPEVIVNLAGENRPDVVEKSWAETSFINMIAPGIMAQWCHDRGRRLIHVSTQGVFGGTRPPYRAVVPSHDDPPVNRYGDQKLVAERQVLHFGGEIARLTFILGIRLLPHVGRANPLEAMLAAISSQTQVEDRFFSPCFAVDAATELWRLVREPAKANRIVHIGIPISISRAQIAQEIIEQTQQPEVESYELNRVKHTDAFPTPKWAPRPIDTTFDRGARFTTRFNAGLKGCIQSWRELLDYMSHKDRAIELSLFFGTSTEEALNHLNRGFGQAHQEVTLDWHRAAPVTDDDILEWYRRTMTYIWELTAYHLDVGFNYMGMCDGIVNHILVRNCRRVLCVGDGVGDLTMRCADAGLAPIYHDLANSKTAEFAKFRMRRRYGRELDTCLTASWDPTEFEPESVDTVLALDFFEHVTDVEQWVIALHRALKPGGLFLAQNAFAMGDIEHGGSIPMHLHRNNRFEKDWDPLLESLGFMREQEGGNWRRKP
jgi:dTDP-4-dehydrorhamnose reductase/2-polyprenyl-3-methyl-5-hydroxy-6-metoxy-1,4-benzoquinol methylase